ncbi:transglutaminase domain-containing protein [Flammeovirga sp. SJP92]|uniref:transglutaminase domain-containing protein n=1 Tax=Flammeovirga sp. SJP92 TaxID=1775430 RepID=UPI0007888E06|nr:transglutaminase domain-containing protein [Flammeovirga sp. SJP92]KXX72407.1 hypothetical protein AVL50_02055 [Flammeovirga sp. SJP92]
MNHLSNFNLFFILLILNIGCSTSKKQTTNEKLVIHTKSGQLTAFINEGVDSHFNWLKVDTLAKEVDWVLNCYAQSEKLKIKSDTDSVEYDLVQNTNQIIEVVFETDSIVRLNIQAKPFTFKKIEYDQKNGLGYEIKYQSKPNEYLKQLAQKYPLDFLDHSKSDTEVVLEVLNWVATRWNHNGNNSPSKNDAITILDEANEGKQFPCFAYAIVLKDQLQTLGYTARTVYLKTNDAATSKNACGHVITEVYLNDLQKWVFLDGQMNTMPMLNGIPLNSVEFQNALTHHYDEVELKTLHPESRYKNIYNDFIYNYLYHLDISLDQCYNKSQTYKINGMRSLMLLPLGAEELKRVPFYNSNIDYCLYTNSLEDFYAKPNFQNKDL